MKIRLTFKTPDILLDTAEQYLDNPEFQRWLLHEEWANPGDKDRQMRDAAEDALEDKLQDIIRSGEYLTIEVDLDTKAATVVAKGE